MKFLYYTIKKFPDEADRWGPNMIDIHIIITIIVSVMVTIAVIKHHERGNLGREDLTYTSSP